MIFTIQYFLSDTCYLILFLLYLPSDTCYMILNIIYLPSDTYYLILTFKYLLYDYYHPILVIWHFLPDTCYLILVIWYQVSATLHWLYDTYHLFLAIDNCYLIIHIWYIPSYTCNLIGAILCLIILTIWFLPIFFLFWGGFPKFKIFPMSYFSPIRWHFSIRMLPLPSFWNNPCNPATMEEAHSWYPTVYLWTTPAFLQGLLMRDWGWK